MRERERPDIMTELEDFKTLYLTNNYRSTKNIQDVSNRIPLSDGVRGDRSISMRGTHDKPPSDVVAVGCDDRKAEATFIANMILNWYGQGVNFGP